MACRGLKSGVRDFFGDGGGGTKWLKRSGGWLSAAGNITIDRFNPDEREGITTKTPRHEGRVAQSRFMRFCVSVVPRHWPKI
jgi:hypothetical protein